MKERYFTLETLHTKTLDMLAQLEPYRRKRPAVLIPDRSALLVLDMQHYFLEAASHAYIPSADAILPGIKSLVQVYAAHGRPVFFSRHLNTAQDAGQMASWWHDLIAEDNPLSEIVSELEVSTGTVICKSQYDAFHATSLEDLLRGGSVGQVLVCGVMTHLCCETTARAAFVRGFEVFFTVDGTATYTEAFHRATLLNLTHGFATLVKISDVLQAVA